MPSSSSSSSSSWYQQLLKYRVPLGFVMHMTAIWLVRNAPVPLMVGVIAVIWWEFAREFPANQRWLLQGSLTLVSLADAAILQGHVLPQFADAFSFPTFVALRSVLLLGAAWALRMSRADIFAIVYLTVTISSGMLVLLHFPVEVLLTITMAIAGSDMFQYFAGKRFGKTKIVPAISPHKTLEGYVAALLVCMAIWYGGLIHEFTWTAFYFTVGMLLCGIFGDLFESWWKRNHHLKDTSSLLSAHGGILDRLDSHLAAWLWTIVFCHLYPQSYGRDFTTMDYDRIEILIVITWVGIWIRFFRSYV